MAAMLICCIAVHGQYNPTNPTEPGGQTETRALNLKCSPDNACTFNIARSTSHEVGSTVKVKAYANTGFRFVRWEENGKELSTAASVNITMNSSRTLTAVLVYDPDSPDEPAEPQEYAPVYVNVAPKGGGSLNIANGNRYVVGSSVKLAVTPYAYYTFLNWTQEGEVISTSKSFNYVVKSVNAPITANFRYDYVYDPSNPGEPDQPKMQKSLSLESNPKGAGYFNVSSGNKYTVGSNVKLIAYANRNYVFRNWTKDGEVISEDSPFTYKMPDANVKLVANYEYVYSPGDPSEPNTPDKDFSIYGMTENVFPGQTINYPVYLQNNREVTGMSIDMRFEDEFMPDPDNLTLTGRASGHEINWSEVEDGSLRIAITGEEPFGDVNGKVFEIPLKVRETASGNQDYPVRLSHGVVMLTDKSQVPVLARDGMIHVGYAPEGSIYAGYSYDKFQNRVKFSNQSAESAIAYEWDFGDGSTSEEENPLHIFPAPGTYKVSLSVSGESGTARYEQNVLINAESTWVASGNFTLGRGDGGVRCFSTYGELIRMLGESHITGDITVNVESGNTFGIDLSDKNSEYLRDIRSALSSGSNMMRFQKSRNGANPIIEYGTATPGQFDKNMVDLIVSLGKLQTYDGVEVRMWGFSFNPSEIERIPRQDVCTGTRTVPVDFSAISTDLQFSWNVSGYYDPELTGYEKSGTRAIPSMNIMNETNGDANLTYDVKATCNGKEFISFQVYITVHPALTGLFSALEPRDGTQFESNNITLSWNNIGNARYDVYLWNAAGQKPEDPVLSDISNLRASVSKYCTNGNRYLWQVRAHSYCQEMWSDTLSFNIGSLPDLHVSRLEVGEAVAGKEMTVSWTVVNDGNGSTGNAQWEDNIWLVPDVYLGTAASYANSKALARLAKTVSNIKSLQPGESYNNSVKIKLDERVYGDYYIIVTSDMHDVKNIRWQTVNNTVPNPYTPSVSGVPYPYLYAETSSSYNKVSEAGETATTSDNFNYAKINIAVPGLVDLAVTDVVAEVDNTPGTITTNLGVIRIEPTPHTTIGLAESKDLYSGKWMKVTATIRNVGSLKMDWTTFANVLYISHSPAFDDPGALMAVASKNLTVFLDPNGTTTVSFECKVPYEWHGDTYFHVVADVNDNVYELASKQNNHCVSAKYDFKLTPTADFQPSNLKVPASIAPQTPFAISYDVKNIGQNVPFNSSWTDLVYLSRKPDLDDTAVQIGSLGQGGVFTYTRPGTPGDGVVVPAKDYIYVGDNYTANRNLTINELAEGDYYLFVKVDGTDHVLEENGEDNNIIRSGVISCTKPDLQIELLSVDCDTIMAGKTVAISWKLTNSGSGIIKNMKSTDAFYSSKNQDGAGAICLGSLTNELFINPGDSQILRGNVKIPEDCKLEGVQYVFMRANTDGKVIESNYDNNGSNVMRTWFKPKPEEEEETPPSPLVKVTDVGISNLTAPSSAAPGETVELRYTLVNSGNKRVDAEITQEVYMSSDSRFGSSAVPCKIFSQEGTSEDLSAEESTPVILKVEVPRSLRGGDTYLHLVIDRQNLLNESNTKNNYASRPFRIAGNLPVMEVEGLTLRDSVMTCVEVPVSWIVKNTGEWKADPVTVGVYRSSSAQWEKGDELLASVRVGSLEPGDSVVQSANITIADKNHGKWNIIVKPDGYDDYAARPVTVVLSPVPDLFVKSLSADGTAWSGQRMTLNATFANIGEYRTRQYKWSEDYYLAQSNILNTATAVRIGSRVHSGALEAGAEYKSAMNVTIPPGVEGNYMVFAVIDGGNSIYESDEDNNLRSIPLFIKGKTGSACDLTASDISAPANINAGENFTLSYRISNAGEFQAKGMCRDVIYLSADDVLDADDAMVGTVSGDINVSPGGYVQRTATGRISNVKDGEYYLIVKTNSTRSIAETETENNSAVLPSKVRINFPALSLNETKSFKTSRYFKLTVPAGYENKTVGFYLGQSEEDSGGLYVAYENVPTTASYDDCSSRPRVAEQEVIIPNVRPGNYYILAQDNAAVVNKDNLAFALGDTDKTKQVPLTISTKDLHFGASSLSVTEGGNNGWISTNIKGALLDSIMDFRLVKEKNIIPVETMHFRGSSSVMATFNLNNAEIGRYDMISELPDGTRSTLGDAFRVLPATETGLEVRLVAPENIRHGGYSPISLAYFNNGNTDVEMYEFMIVVEGVTIALTCEELERSTQDTLHIRPNLERNHRGYVSIPPGTKEVLNFFVRNIDPVWNQMTVYLIK